MGAYGPRNPEQESVIQDLQRRVSDAATDMYPVASVLSSLLDLNDSPIDDIGICAVVVTRSPYDIDPRNATVLAAGNSSVMLSEANGEARSRRYNDIDQILDVQKTLQAALDLMDHIVIEMRKREKEEGKDKGKEKG